jgi:hypothetical protein
MCENIPRFIIVQWMELRIPFTPASQNSGYLEVQLRKWVVIPDGKYFSIESVPSQVHHSGSFRSSETTVGQSPQRRHSRRKKDWPTFCQLCPLASFLPSWFGAVILNQLTIGSPPWRRKPQLNSQEGMHRFILPLRESLRGFYRTWWAWAFLSNFDVNTTERKRALQMFWDESLYLFTSITILISRQTEISNVVPGRSAIWPKNEKQTKMLS